MPFFTISVAGGLFTATSSWEGGVVPPSSNTSDIVGASYSGNLTFNSIGTYNLGSLYFDEYRGTLAFTGSGPSMRPQGLTISFSSAMTFLGGSGEFKFQPTISGIAQRFWLRGMTLSNHFWAFDCNIPHQMNDDLNLINNFTIRTNAGAARTNWIMFGPTLSTEILATGSRANINCYGTITINSENANSNNRGYQVNFNILSGTTSIGSTSNVDTIKPDTRIVVNGGALRLLNIPKLETGVQIDYISGTISGINRLRLTPPNANNYGVEFRKLSYTFNTPGHTWAEIALNPFSNQNITQTYSINFLGDFNVRKFYVMDQNTAVSTRVRDYELIATQSVNINLGDFITNYTQLSSDQTYNPWQKWYFSAHTFSINRFCMIANNFAEYGNELVFFSPSSDLRNGPQFEVRGLNTGATINLLKNESYALGVSFSNINFTGNNLYAFGSTWSNSTGILDAFPTGGGGGGTAAETSYAYIA